MIRGGEINSGKWIKEEKKRGEEWEREGKGKKTNISEVATTQKSWIDDPNSERLALKMLIPRNIFPNFHIQKIQLG